MAIIVNNAQRSAATGPARSVATMNMTVNVAPNNPAPGANRRLGLHVTSDELAIWQQRMTDNVNTINGQTFKFIYDNRIKPDADHFRTDTSHPSTSADGRYAGYTGAGCAPDNQTYGAGAGGTPFGRGNGAYMMRSAFTYLLTGDTIYADPVRSELVAQIAVAGTDWTNTSKWCHDTLGGQPWIEILPWFFRMIISYDYLRAGGYTGWSGSEETNVRQWLHDGATFWAIHSMIHNSQVNTSYQGIFDSPQDFSCIVDCTSNRGQIYFGSPTMKNASYFSFFNQQSFVPPAAMAVGLLVNDQDLIDMAANYVRAFIRLGIFDDGAVSDYDRTKDCTPPCPASWMDHCCGQLNGIIAVADMYARAGNTSLYDLSLPTEIINGSGGTVSLELPLELMCKLNNGTTTYKCLDNSTVMDWTDPVFGSRYNDFGFMAANMYYQNSHITTAMERNLTSGHGSDSGDCDDNQYGGCWSGNYAAWADCPFMFGKLQGVVNPYL